MKKERSSIPGTGANKRSMYERIMLLLNIYQIKKDVLYEHLFYFIMQEKRLELSWYCYHTDLNRARLPIPPSLQGSYYYNTISYVCQVIF